ncbi:MAG TPA: O-antigen ligase family protein [bacterium]|nr:O-antigen ligase family protein [bacterium]
MGLISARAPAVAREAGFRPVPLAMAAVLVASSAALLAVALGQSRLTVQAAGVGALLFGVLLLAVRERSLLLLVGYVLACQRLFYRPLGPIDGEVAGGVPGLYVRSVDALLIVLFAAWLAEGTLVRDLRDALRRPGVAVPLLAPLAALPSVLVAESPYLALSELYRMGWMLALYVYVAARLRDRRSVMVVLAALFAIPFIQLAVELAQWATQSTLGLVRVGEDPGLITRAAGETEIVRPAGTALHPVFLSALLAPIALLALSVGVSLRRPVPRLLCFASVAAGLAGMVLAQTRVAFVAMVPLAFLLIVWAARSGHLSSRAAALVLAAGTLLVSVSVSVLYGNVVEAIARNFTSEQVGVEASARQQLNEVALRVIRDAPVIGVGLNNYEQVLPRYDVYGVGLEGFPPHNLYLLVMADSGAIGLIGMGAAALALVGIALRLARVRDPQLSAVGVGALAMYAFFALEELTSFSLRHDVPLLEFWIIAGLAAASLRIAEREASTPLQRSAQ